MGTVHYPLSQQIADTARVHGITWAAWAYCIDPKGPRLSASEWAILSRGI